MYRGNNGWVTGELKNSSSALDDTKIGAQERLGSGRPEANDQSGFDCRNLRIQPWTARCDFTHGRLFVDTSFATRLPLEMFDCICDVSNVAVDTRLFQTVIEKMACRPDKGSSLKI